MTCWDIYTLCVEWTEIAIRGQKIRWLFKTNIVSQILMLWSYLGYGLMFIVLEIFIFIIFFICLFSTDLQKFQKNIFVKKPYFSRPKIIVLVKISKKSSNFVSFGFFIKFVSIHVKCIWNIHQKFFQIF